MDKEDNVKHIMSFLGEMDWMFQVNNFERDVTTLKEDDGETAAKIEFAEDYQRIKIKLYPVFFEHSLEEQRKMLLHEMCHTITLPSKLALNDTLKGLLITPERIREINERETSQIENLLHNLLIGRMQYAIKAYKNYMNCDKPKKKDMKKKMTKMKPKKSKKK